MRRMLVAICIVSINLIFINHTIAQDKYKYDYEVVSKIVFMDKQIIKRILMDSYIPESDVERIEIFDIDNTGPNEGDLMRVLPSRSVYTLSMLTKETNKILADVEPDSNLGKIGLTSFIIQSKPKTAKEKILYILGLAIKELYAQDKPIKVYFEQFEDGTFKFNLYGFEAGQMKDSADVDFGKVQNTQVQDLLKALYQEFSSEYKGFQPTVVRIREVIKDTVYVPIYKKGSKN